VEFLMNAPVQQHRIARRRFKGIEKLAMLGVFVIAALLLVLWVEHSMRITLPTPTGSFAVGRAIYDWTDDETLDTLAPVSGTKRELLVWIWYPSTPGQPAANADYLPAPWRTAIERNSGALISKFLTKDLSKVHPNSLRNIDVSPQQPSYPVVIMRGGASREVASYTTLAEDLASHGYIVVGIDAPYRTSVAVFPDGRVMKRTPENNPELCFERAGQEQFNCLNKLLNAWTADIAFVLDRLDRLNTSDMSGRFTGRLDMSRVGIFGHSFGGAQAAQFCALNSRCKAGIDIDGAPFGSVIQTGIPKPFMFLLSGQGDFSTDAEVRQIMADIQSIYDRLPADGRLRVVIRGANHFTFSDDGALLKSHLLRTVLRAFGKLGIDGRRQLAVTSYCIHSFFDVYLKGTSPPPLNISSPLYPEIQVLD
jgi:predicted dienelactone hydrolase